MNASSSTNLQQPQAVEILLRSVASGRLPHAILLHGPSLSALEEAAGIVASKHLGISTEKLANTPDFFALRPTNKMRQIGAEPTRELVQNIQRSSYEGKGKIAFVYDADRMNISAANIFLKTLEEPPADTTIFLLSSSPYRILDTIRSRCFSFKIDEKAQKTAHPADWQAWLDDLSAFLEKAHTNAQLNAEGRCELIMHVYRLIQDFDQSLKAATKDTLSGLEKSETLSEDEQAAQASALEKSLRDERLRSIEETIHYFALGQNPIPSAQLARAVKLLEELRGLLEVNLNILTALENLFVNLIKIFKK